MSKPTKCPKCGVPFPAEARFCGSCGAKVAGNPLSPDGDPLIGALVGGRFLVLEKIGHGGMGVVYRAEQTSIWRPVALKVLHPKYSQDTNLVARFRNEAATASRLNHPNTITVYDFGLTEKNALYLAMEFVEGESLDGALRAEGALEWPRVCRIAMQICDSLQNAHNNNIIHRDLKPENIMLTRRGTKTDIVKVLDFGIAKILASETRESMPALTSVDEVIGTPEYMSPEQITGEKLDARSDVYSLGVILFRMLTGNLPFEAPNPLAMMAKHLTGTPRSFVVPKDRQTPPQTLESLVISSLAKKTDNRPAKMSDVAEWLAEALTHEASEAEVSPTKKEAAPAVDAPPPKEVSKNPTEIVQTHESVRRQKQPADQPAPAADPSPKQRSPRDRPIKAQPRPRPRPMNLRATQRDNQPYQPPARVPPASGADRGGPPKRDQTKSSPPADDEAKPQNRKESILDALADKMKKQRDFPVMAGNLTDLKAAASKKQTSARELANIILKDFGLTSKLLKMVNSPYYGQVRGRVTTVSRAVVILGFEQVRQLALGLVMFEHIQKANRNQAAAMADSHLASLMSGLVAQGVAGRMKGMDNEEAFICAMFYNLGKQAVIYYFPEEYQRILRLAKRQKKAENDVAQRVLGVSYWEVGQVIAKHWALPDTLSEAMVQLPQKKLARPRNKAERMRNLAGFSNKLAEIATNRSPVMRKPAIEKLMAKYENSFPISDIQINQIVDEATEEVVEATKRFNLNLGESRIMKKLLRRAGESKEQKPPPAREAKPGEDAHPTPETMATDSSESDQGTSPGTGSRVRVLAQSVEETATAMQGQYDLNQLILMVLEAMYRGLHLNRVIFCLNDVKTKSMRARSGFGNDIERFIKSFSFALDNGEDLFNQALSRGIDVVLDRQKNRRMAQKIPPWHRTLSDAPIFIIFPIIVQDFPAGMFYGEVEEDHAGLDNEALFYMNQLRQQAASAIREKRGV